MPQSVAFAPGEGGSSCARSSPLRHCDNRRHSAIKIWAPRPAEPGVPKPHRRHRHGSPHPPRQQQAPGAGLGPNGSSWQRINRGEEYAGTALSGGREGRQAAPEQSRRVVPPRKAACGAGTPPCSTHTTPRVPPAPVPSEQPGSAAGRPC